MSTSVFLENVLRRINDGEVPPDASVSHFPHNSTVHLIFPEVGANARQIIEILKVLEILTFLRGISPYGVMDRDALNDLTDFLKEVPSATRYGRSLLPSDSIGYADGIRASIFEAWMLKRLNNFPIYPLQDIRKGSYEFIFLVFV